MTKWILDTNIVIYLLARDKLLRDPRAQHMRTTLKNVDQALRTHTSAGGKLLLTPVVVQEAVDVLEGAYGYSPSESATKLIQFIRSPEVIDILMLP